MNEEEEILLNIILNKLTKEEKTFLFKTFKGIAENNFNAGKTMPYLTYEQFDFIAEQCKNSKDE
jgi:hypothetical protein